MLEEFGMVVVVESIAIKQTYRFRDWSIVRNAVSIPKTPKLSHLTQRKPLGRANLDLKTAQQLLTLLESVWMGFWAFLRPLGRGTRRS